MGSSRGADPGFLNTVDNLFPRFDALFAAGEAVEDLLAHPGWAHIMRVLDAEVAELDRKLDGARVLDSRAEYAHGHGRRGGLRGASEAAAAIRSRAARKLAEQQAKHEDSAESLSGGTR